MRFAGYLNENTDVWRKECSEYTQLVSSCGNHFYLYRGANKEVHDFLKVIPRTNREPRDSSQYNHDKFNKLFLKKFGWKVRDGVMTIPDAKMARGYALEAGGSQEYEFYPTNGFKYVWSPVVEDFFFEFNTLWPGGDYGAKPVPVIYKMFTDRMAGVLESLGKTNYIKDLSKFDNTHDMSQFVAEAAVETYIDSGLCRARGTKNEIVFKCDSYYLVEKGMGL